MADNEVCFRAASDPTAQTTTVHGTWLCCSSNRIAWLQEGNGKAKATLTRLRLMFCEVYPSFGEAVGRKGTGFLWKEDVSNLVQEEEDEEDEEEAGFNRRLCLLPRA